jgi:primosomal protein N' (replication factor Y)
MPASFLQVVVNVPLVTGVFDYGVPPVLASDVGPGTLVLVPFGRQIVQGVVLRNIEKPSVATVKEILAILDPTPVVNDVQLSVAEELALETRAPLAAILGLFIPPGLGRQADDEYSLLQSTSQHTSSRREGEAGPVAGRLINLLGERGSLRGRQIDAHFRNVEWRRSMKYLVEQGRVISRPLLPPTSVRPKQVRTAQLAVAPPTAMASLDRLGRTPETRGRREKILQLLISRPEAINVSWIYAETGCNRGDLQELAERELIVLRESEIWRDPVARTAARVAPHVPTGLTPEQDEAWKMIRSAFGELKAGNHTKPFLLHGVAGSGKTELYIRAAQEAIRLGRQAIILVPEIALTPQTVERFAHRFPGQTGLVHSRLSDGERYDTWRRARAGQLNVIIGPRSALFAPLPMVGLIVLDECHDASYYQSEPPFYNANSMAHIYARHARAVLMLGSATPTVVQRHDANLGRSTLLEMTRRVLSARTGDKDPGLPPVSIVDMRQELTSGHRGIFSRLLTERLASVLARGEQAILFLNRRGTATYVFCRTCGTAIRCPRCDTPMTLHAETREHLLCHHCGYERGVPKRCPHCGSGTIGAYGLGSEKVEAEVVKLFPTARVLRWDWETTRQKDAHEAILSHFAAHRADVLVGTQMLAKGLDVPLVTLVGVVLAEVGLNLPDPFAVERMFQTLTHVAGRAGRGDRPGEVIMQTFAPENRAIRAAAAFDYDGFAAQELRERARLRYPPFGRVIRLEYRDSNPDRAEAKARELAEDLRRSPAGKGLGKPHGAASAGQSEADFEAEVIGPVPCFYRRLRGLYRWQIVLRGQDPASSLPDQTPAGWRVEVDPISLL